LHNSLFTKDNIIINNENKKKNKNLYPKQYI